MELRELITPAGRGSSNGDAQLAWYTKDLMVEETSSPSSSPQLSFSSSDSTTSSPLADLYILHRPSGGGSVRATPPTTLTKTPAGPAQPVFSLPTSRPRVGSSSALLPVPSSESKSRAYASRRQPKRKRSISDSLVPSVSRKEEGGDGDGIDVDELCIDEFDGAEHAQLDASHPSKHQPPAAVEDDDESDGFVESGEEGDDGQADLGRDSSPRIVRLQGHESGPPSPPAHYQHGMNENPDGTAYYHCKFCQHTWPQHHFRNAQQFGAHCSNCSRKRKVKDPQDMTTTTRERNKRLRKGKRSRSSSASKALFDQTRHKLVDSDDSTPECSSQEQISFSTEEKARKQQSAAAAAVREPASKKFRARVAGARSQPARALPPLIGKRFPASPPTSVDGAAAVRSEGSEAMDGMERLFGAMTKRETVEVSHKKKSIFALLAYVKTELASLKEQEDGEEIEVATREMIQDTRTEWESRIQELRVDAASDLRAHSTALPRRLDRLTSLHPHHPGRQQQIVGGTRNSLDFILNGTSEADPLPEIPSPAWSFSSSAAAGGRASAVPATPPPSPLPAARHQQRGAEVLNLALSSSTGFNGNRPASNGFIPGLSCVRPSTSSLACASPLASPL